MSPLVTRLPRETGPRVAALGAWWVRPNDSTETDRVWCPYRSTAGIRSVTAQPSGMQAGGRPEVGHTYSRSSGSSPKIGR
ncbi:hypothetical protein GCM10023096_87120 [Nonomuraea ferruginea]